MIFIEVASIFLGIMANRPIRVNKITKGGGDNKKKATEIAYLISKRNSTMFIQVNINRNICHETILLTTMWLLLLERNMVEGISTPITALINCVCFYNMTSHIMMITICYVKIYGKMVNSILLAKSIYMNYIILYIFVIPIMYSYQTYITYYYFLKPLFKRSLQSMNLYSTQLIIVIYIVIIGLSLYRIKLYANKCFKDIQERDNNKKIIAANNNTAAPIEKKAKKK